MLHANDIFEKVVQSIISFAYAMHLDMQFC